MRYPEPITVRRMPIEFPDAMGTAWCGDNAYLSALLGALSVAFPPGERLFIDSVRHFADDIDDPELKERIRAFVQQEAHHTKEHIAFNAFLDRVGYPAAKMEAWVTRRIGELKKRSRPEANLARTAALEHFTAILASAMLEHPDLLERMSPPAAKLWAWHAIEEIEHRDVAFDVYQHAVGDEALRVRTMALVTAFFLTLVSIRTVLMMRATNRLGDVGSIAEGLHLLWVRPGLFRKLIPSYLAYYRPDFHPAETDYSALVARARRRFLGER